MTVGELIDHLSKAPRDMEMAFIYDNGTLVDEDDCIDIFGVCPAKETGLRYDVFMIELK